MVHGVDELARAGEQQERITIAFLALAWLFIFLRIWTRTWVIASFGWDDATMILAGVWLPVGLRPREPHMTNRLADNLYYLHWFPTIHRSEWRRHACYKS